MKKNAMTKKNGSRIRSLFTIDPQKMRRSVQKMSRQVFTRGPIQTWIRKIQVRLILLLALWRSFSDFCNRQFRWGSFCTGIYNITSRCFIATGRAIAADGWARHAAAGWADFATACFTSRAA
jgi:hypothetical protein